MVQTSWFIINLDLLATPQSHLQYLSCIFLGNLVVMKKVYCRVDGVDCYGKFASVRLECFKLLGPIYKQIYISLLELK